MLYHTKISGKIISFFLVLLIILGLGACGSSDKTEKTDLSNFKNEVSATKSDNKNDKYKVLKKARQLAPEVPGSIETANEDKLVFYYNGKKGYMNESGKVIIDAKYSQASDFSEKYALVLDANGAVFIINEQGEEIPVQIAANENQRISVSGPIGSAAWDITQKTRFSNETAIIRVSGIHPYDPDDYYFVQTDATIVKKITTDKYACISYDFTTGCAVFTNNERKVFLFNQLGEEIPLNADFHFDKDKTGYNCGFYDGLLIVEDTNGSMGAIDKDGNVVIPFEYEQLKKPENNRIPFLKYGKWGYIDYKNNVVIEPTYISVQEFCSGLAKVETQEGKTSYIDTDNKIIIAEGENIKGFYEGGFAITAQGVINTKGEMIAGVSFSSTDRYFVYDGKFFLNPEQKTCQYFVFS